MEGGYPVHTGNNIANQFINALAQGVSVIFQQFGHVWASYYGNYLQRLVYPNLTYELPVDPVKSMWKSFEFANTLLSSVQLSPFEFNIGNEQKDHSPSSIYKLTNNDILHFASSPLNVIQLGKYLYFTYIFDLI